MWTCPKCGTKVDPSFEVCWQCGTSQDGTEDPNFVSADNAPVNREPVVPQFDTASIDPSPRAGLVSCYEAFSVVEAKFIADQLNENGITAVSDTLDLQDALGPLDGNPRVYCRQEDLAAARAWLAEYEANKRADLRRRLEE